MGEKRLASGSMDAANLLKPALARGAIRVIGAAAAVRFRTLTPQGEVEEKSCGETPPQRSGARRSSHLVVGGDEIAAAVVLILT